MTPSHAREGESSTSSISTSPRPAKVQRRETSIFCKDSQAIDSPCSEVSRIPTYDGRKGDETTVQVISAASSPEPRGKAIQPEEVNDDHDIEVEEDRSTASRTAIDALEDELTCGMCAGIFIDPVVLDGCGHCFCGSCTKRWIDSMPRYQNQYPDEPPPKPTACPHCRYTPITEARPSRLARAMIDILLKARPEAARASGEKIQAELVYTQHMGTLKFPVPPRIKPSRDHEFWRPCRSCYPAVEGAWKCPVPVARPYIAEEKDKCLRKDGICPDGHRLCSSCDQLSPSASPTSANCGICGEGVCGEPSSPSCACTLLSAASPGPNWQSLALALDDCPSDAMTLAFRDNYYEVKYLARYLASPAIEMIHTANSVFSDIVAWLSTTDCQNSGGMSGLMKRGRAMLGNRTATVQDVNGDMGSVKACNGCIEDIFCAALPEWWIRELAKPEVLARLPAKFKDRPKCKEGRTCNRQHSRRHAKKYNHMCEASTPSDPVQEVPPSNVSNYAAQSSETNPPNEETTSDVDESDMDEDSDDESDDTPPASKNNYVDVGIQCESTTIDVDQAGDTAHPDNTAPRIAESSMVNLTV